MKHRHFSDEEIGKMLKMRADGVLVKDIANHFGITTATVSYHTYQGGKKRKLTQANKRVRDELKFRKSLDCVKFDFVPEETRQMAERLMRQVPRDTRDLTGRVFGDPIPGRSALDQRQNA